MLNENGHAVAIESKIDIQSRTKAAITATAEKFSDTMASTGEQNITIGNNTVRAISMVTPTSEPSALPSIVPTSSPTMDTALINECFSLHSNLMMKKKVITTEEFLCYH